MNLLFICKSNSDNFIRNYTRYLGQHAEGDLFIVDSRAIGERRSIELVREKTQKPYTHLIFEWANDLTGLCLQSPFKQKVIVRLHDHELRQNQDGYRRIDRINFSNVDAVWCVNKDVEREFKQVTNNQVKTFSLPNAVDPAPFEENLSNQNKIGLLSIYARKRKRIDRAINLMRLLPDWDLHIRCEADSPDEELGENHFQDLLKLSQIVPNVHWELRIADFVNNGYGQKDVNEFFQDKAIVLSTSDREAFGYSIAEGALCGAMPCVFKWPHGGADKIWRQYSHDSLEQMAEAIRRYKPSKEYRQYVLDNYSPNVLWPKLLKLI